MKTKWRLFCILWSFLSLPGPGSCTADTYDPPSALKRETVIKRVSQKPTFDAIKPSTAGERESRQKFPAGFHPPTPAAPRAKTQSGFAALPDVSVTCSTSDFLVRVKPSFYGFGADASELNLGGTCRSTGVLRPYGDLLFKYPLTACDSQRELRPGYLVYKFRLHYEPSLKRFPSRAHPFDVVIECRYQRNHHVYQLAVKPTWQTAVVLKRLRGRPSDFQIQLMDDSWSGPAKSEVFQLGQTLHLQVSAPQLPAGEKLYVRSCDAAPSSGSSSSLKYTIIGNSGCMLDSKREPGASRFISRTDKSLRFSLKSFQFISDPDTEISVHCRLIATSEKPSAAHKSCTYEGSRWKALTGDDAVCKCCDSQCVTLKPPRATMEGSARSRLLLVSDQPLAEEGLLPVSPSMVSLGGDGGTTELDGPQMFGDYLDGLDYGGGEEEQDYVEEEEEEGMLEEGRGLIILGEMFEPELETFIFRKRADGEEFGDPDSSEDGSGYEANEDNLGNKGAGGFEGRDVERMVHGNQEEGERLLSQASLHGEVDSEGEEETGRGEVQWEWSDDDSHDGERTWYFTWR